MKRIWKEYFWQQTVGLCLACGVAAGIVYGLVQPPFYLHFIDGLTYAGFLLLAFGFLRWNWIHGEFAGFSYRRAFGSMADYRRQLAAARKDKKNPALYAGILLFLISTIMAVLY